MDKWGKPEEDTGQDGYDKCEKQDRPIQLDFLNTRNAT